MKNKANYVVLITIVAPVPKEARAEIHVVEDEPAKVRTERLQPSAEGQEVVVLG